MRTIRTGVAAAVVAALAPAVHAEQAPGVLEEVVVTAQKRESSLQDVPFSVAAATESQLRNANVGNIVDLARNVAGVAIADLGPGQSQVAVRGISAGQVIRDQPGVKEQVGVYLDESPISVALFTPDLELFDLQRFEVLRGPQGTLFGAGSLSGTLRYITQQPKLGAVEGVAEISGQTVTDGGSGGAARAALNLPLGTTAAIRAVGYYNKLPGFVDAIQPDGSVKKDVNSGDRTGGRVAVLWKPTEQLSITPRLVYQKLSTDGFPRVDLFNILGNPYMTTQPKVTFGDLQQYRQQREGIDDDFRLADLNVAYDFGPATLTSVTSYIDRDVLVTRDATQLTGSITWDFGFRTPAAVRLSSKLLDKTKLKSWSEELRLSSNGEGALQWLVGGFYQHVDRDYSQTLPTPGWDAATGLPNLAVLAPADSPYNSTLSYSFKQFAVFGEATYRFTDQWRLTAGARYYDFKEDRTGDQRGQFVDVAPVKITGKTDATGFAPRVILGYQPVDTALITVQAARGFRLGGINDALNVPLCSPQDLVTFGGRGNWDDEKSWNYELGGKFQFADRRVTLNVAAFYADVKNLQATVTAGTCSSRIVFNVPKSHSQGLEAELFVRATDRWDFGLSATVIDAKLDSTVASTSGGVTTVVGGLEKGNRLPTAPKFQGVASVGYTVPLASRGDLFANLTWQYLGSSYSQFENEAPGFGQVGGTAAGAARLIPFGGVPANTVFTFDPELDAYSIGNLRVGFRTPVWEIAGFVSNLADERARLALDYERGRSARVAYLTNAPRTYGVTLRYSF